MNTLKRTILNTHTTVMWVVRDSPKTKYLQPQKEEQQKSEKIQLSMCDYNCNTVNELKTHISINHDVK